MSLESKKINKMETVLQTFEISVPLKLKKTLQNILSKLRKWDKLESGNLREIIHIPLYKECVFVLIH